MLQKKVFKMFSTCFTTKGNRRGIITDSQRGEYYTVPLSLIDFIDDNKNCSIDAIKLKYKESDFEVIKEYLAFLEENEFCFYCNDLVQENFTELDLTFNYPASISNAILELVNYDTAQLENHIAQLANLNCISIAVYINFSIVEEEVSGLLALLKAFGFDHVNLIFNQSIVFDLGEMKRNYPMLNAVISKERSNETFYDEKNRLKVQQRNAQTIDFRSCGCVNETFFNLGLNHYTESLAHNTCLNRKIAIDAEGNIRNCPGMRESFGNISDTTLREVIEDPGFKKYWNIKKEEISKCKDCEFRNICTDCRAFTDDPEDIYSAPLKCGYDPYTCDWQDWSTNPLKQRAIDYYGMREIMNKE